ncbi:MULTISPECIES: autorepressor SdpR family transcription factor [unclassified Lysinibacillus]|uniref:autorepressor SdpR family transcription factor n=1 Tax=unclassified Lysinibacillus TaxID=2636778 RepID=UPI0018FF2931|nr:MULTISPECIES: autorepressor SdpR family transcription factor [unclassified Lysinibacillus]
MGDIFKAIADPIRREILNLLKESDLTVNEIVEKFNISQPSISNHLTILRNAGLITSEKSGRHIYYSLNTTVLEESFKWFLSLINTKG